MIKKQETQKAVHRFTENAHMKFRPLHYQPSKQGHSQPKEGFTSTVSKILGGLFQSNPSKTGQRSSKNVTFLKPSPSERSGGKNRSSILQRNGSSMLQPQFPQHSLIDNRSTSRINVDGDVLQYDDSSICFLQKINVQSYLIGNQHQLDMISITGIYENRLDTELNWQFSLPKKMKKVTVDQKKMYIAIEVQDQVWIYKYDIRNIKYPPIYVNRIKVIGGISFLMFLRDAVFGVFYPTHLIIYQIEENNTIRIIFNKKYGVAETVELIQVPKPIEFMLNIFFKERSQTAQVYTLWRLQFDLKSISSHQNFRSLMRIYDIPNRLLNELKINNYTKDTFIMNFKYQILAAKDGYIIDSANMNIEEDESCLIHQGDHLLLISDIKLQLYKFRIAANFKPNKIIVQSQDSIQIQKDSCYRFMDCLEMFNGNFVLFYQIKPQNNRKTKGEIDYIITATQKLTVSEKLNEIFSFKSPEQLREIAAENYSEIQNKCDIAFKIGLSRKEVFLELWNRSGKSEVDDFKFLLDTLDYETIKEEIQKKLKKASMTFREVYKLEQYCFEMLKNEAFGNQCTENSIKNYIKSHFFLRKLEYFRDWNILIRGFGEDDQKKSLTIDIQQYFNCFNSYLKAYFLEIAFKICFQEKEVSKQLRLFMKSFRFPLRIIYTQLLEQLIKQSKNKLINFLKAIPEILPYQYSSLPESEDHFLYMGLFAPIQPEEWSKNLHIEQISTIYNRECIDQVIKTVWFKRNQYSLHDLIPLPKQKIKEIQEFNASDGIFYYFIEKIFEHCPKDQEEVVIFLQSNYDKLPQHLKGRIFLYRNLYDYFIEEKWSSPILSTFNTFLKMQDFQLFRELFKYEKIKKGCLLKDAKQIYSQMIDGNQFYNQSLLRYFTSDLSEISDLKCILNRLNNEKRQFHMENEGIYEVLVRGMQTKLKLGSSNDIPLEEVMIYVENIPLTKNNPIIEQLKTIQKINEEADRFKSIKINLSFLEIMEKEEYVISALLDEEIRKKEIMKSTDPQEFILATYEILAEMQIVKEKIYKDQFRDLEYFLYLNKLLQHKEMIRFAKRVLEDPHLAAQYVFDDTIVENLVLYMYKWRLEDDTYIAHQDYVMELVTILHQDSSIRKYIQAETQFAVMLSSPDNPVQYPLAVSEQNSSLTTVRLCEIEALFAKFDSDFIMNMDLQKLCDLVKEMQLFYEEQVIKLQDIYQIAIKKLLKQKEVVKAIPKIRKLIELRGDQENYSAVFCYLILDIIITDIPTESHKRDLAKIAFYTYSKPLELLDIIEKRLTSVFSTDQQEAYFKQQLKRVKGYRCYNPENSLLDQDVIAKVKQKQQRYNPIFQELIFHTWDQLAASRQDFVKFQYTCIYIFILHNPYAFAKFISVNIDNLSLRVIRSYISYIFKEEIFNRMNILKFAKRAFIIAYENLYTQLTVQYITSQYTGVGFDEEEQVQFEESDENKLVKCIKAFDKKLQSIKAKQQPAPEDQSAKKKRIQNLLSQEVSIQHEQSEYPFSDSDDNYESPEEQAKDVSLPKSKKKADRKPLRQQKKLALFLSSAGEEPQLRRTSPRMLKNSLTFHNQFQSVHISRKDKRKRSDLYQNEKKIAFAHTDSLEPETDQVPLMKEVSKSQNFRRPKKDTMEEDLMYISLEQRRLSNTLKANPPFNWSGKHYNGEAPLSEGDRSPVVLSESNTPPKSPIKLSHQESQIRIEGAQEENHLDAMTESLQIPDIAFTVNIQQINDEDYTPTSSLAKQLLEDYDINDQESLFNLSLIEAQREKELGPFEPYLKKLIIKIYQQSGKPLKVILQLISSINNHYPSLGIQAEFLKIYKALENYNTKYKYNLPIREMFPIQGIFLQSADIKALFQSVKEQILSYVDFEKLMVVAKVIHFSFQKSQIKDELYFSYLCRAIESYGNDGTSSEEELLMEKQRIGGIIDQIILVNIFIEKGRDLLGNVSIASRREQIVELIVQALRKKKKENLIGQFKKLVNKLE